MWSDRSANERWSRATALAALTMLASAGALGAQAGAPTPPSPLQAAMRPAVQLDLEGRTTQARTLLQQIYDSATTPADRAQVQRAIAMSYAFDGNCAQTVAHELPVIDYWKTRQEAEPQNAFYQEGEIADEAARVCIDAGDLATAEKWYRAGYSYGIAEPAPKTHPASLWDFRLANALGRLAARRGDAVEAHRQIAAARHALDSDSAMAAQQERFFPYLVGYVALYTNDLSTAEAQLKQALGMRGNENDPFLWYLLGLTYQGGGRTSDAASANVKAYSLARAHNPPSAAVRRALRGMVAGS